MKTILIIDSNLYEINDSMIDVYDTTTGQIISQQNNFTSIFNLPTDSIDAAINWGNGKVYFFKEDSYYRYDIATNQCDEGFPKKIAESWSGLWSANIWACVRKDDKAYFFGGEEYMRYDCTADAVDAEYPKNIAANWAGLPVSINGIAMLNNQFALVQNNNNYFLYDWDGDFVVNNTSDTLSNILQQHINGGNKNENEESEVFLNRLMLKLKDDSPLKSQDNITLEDLSISTQEKLSFEREFSEEDFVMLNDLSKNANENDSSYSVVDFSTHYFLTIPKSFDSGSILSQLAQNENIEFAFEEVLPVTSTVTAAQNPRVIFQDYNFAAPVGVASSVAWDKDITGKGVQVTDIEFEWDLNHEDLPSGIPLLIGDNKVNFKNKEDHGTCVLGIICGQDNTKGIIGTAPDVTMKVAGVKTGFTWSVAKALTKAIGESKAGDIILIEQQLGSPLLPISYFPNVFQLIELATKTGIIVIEPAGNGNIDLDKQIFFLNGKKIYNRNLPDFKDSGSIMVGAASSKDPHTKMSFSNFGSRVDCYAYGENVVTTSKNNNYTSTFNGTSSASPIITAVAALIQQYEFEKNGKKLTPAEMRLKLTDAANSTTSANPSTDKIGVMPDLKKIII